MRTVSDLLALAGAKLAADAPSLAPDDRPDGSVREKSTLADVGARIGEDNEALRNLLIDTSHHLGTIDTLKETFGKLVDPLHNVLTALEKERAQHASTKGALAAFRSSQEALRADLQALEKTAAELKDDKTKLGRALEAAQQRVRELEDDKTRLNGEVAAARAATAKTVKQLEEQTANVRSLSEEKRLLSDRGDLADKRVITLEAEVALARERLALLESDKDSLQSALNKTLGESSRMSQHLAKTEGALTEARSRNQQLETSLATAEAERLRLAAACDEANERRQNEVYALGLKLDALGSRSDAAQKLLANVRQNLVARTEETRTAEAQLLEANIARSAAEKKAEQLAATSESAEQAAQKFERENAELTERCKMLVDKLFANETSLAHAQEQIKSLTAETEQLHAQAAAARADTEESFAKLTAAIEQERCGRNLAESALETTRVDCTRLQRELVQERNTRRVDH